MLTLEPRQLDYPVVETFHSIQGEGIWTGVSAFFIRLAGCDVGCWFCDTKISWNLKQHSRPDIQHLVAEAVPAQPTIVVVTGWEPLMHNLFPLTMALRQQWLRVHLETSGTHPLTGTFDWITLSPKQFNPPQTSIYGQINELKVVVAAPGDLIWAEEQAAQISPGIPKLLQPEWSTPGSQRLVIDYVLAHPDWRVSLQSHKYLQVC